MHDLLSRVKQAVSDIETAHSVTKEHPVWVAFIPTAYKEARQHLDEFTTICIGQYIRAKFPALQDHILTDEQREEQQILYETIENE